jgi:Spy/CpxP family protein refolding chaperone
MVALTPEQQAWLAATEEQRKKSKRRRKRARLHDTMTTKQLSGG